MNFGAVVKQDLTQRVKNTILSPMSEIVNHSLADIATTIGKFVVRAVRGKFQRSITFTVGQDYYSDWMEEALYNIIYRWNNIKNYTQLKFVTINDYNKGSRTSYYLPAGIHNLRYRGWKIILGIEGENYSSNNKVHSLRKYTIITYNLGEDFVRAFEKDMLEYRNSALRINKDSPTITIFTDEQDDGYTYWRKSHIVPKRRLNTVYIPSKQKRVLVDTLNNFFSNKKFYNEHGIPHNLKIILHGPAGTGKSSLVKMIASEWNMNVFECKGGRSGRYIPDAISHYIEEKYPLYSISDADKYPFLINQQDINLSKKAAKEEEVYWNQLFNKMLNALDGIDCGEDKIIIITTNHIEKFSPVLLRPGRIDLILEIKPVCEETFRQFVFDYYKKELPADIQLLRKDIVVSEMQFDVIFAKMQFEEFINKYTKSK